MKVVIPRTSCRDEKVVFSTPLSEYEVFHQDIWEENASEDPFWLSKVNFHGESTWRQQLMKICLKISVFKALKMLDFDHFFNIGQRLLPVCWPFVKFDFGKMERVIWSPFTPNILMKYLIFTSGGRKNHFFVPTWRSWNNYLHILKNRFFQGIWKKKLRAILVINV